jgi:hypothetical protein
MSSRPELVYFIEAVGLDLIKICYARDIRKRMRRLSTGCPAPLRLLGTFPGGLEIERHYHKRLAACRAHGEWFRRSPALDAVLAGLDEPALKKRPRRTGASRMTEEEYRTHTDRLFATWAEQKKQKAAAAAQRRQEKAAQIAARLP